jgi:hypothetical protein
VPCGVLVKDEIFVDEQEIGTTGFWRGLTRDSGFSMLAGDLTSMSKGGIPR